MIEKRNIPASQIQKMALFHPWNRHWTYTLGWNFFLDHFISSDLEFELLSSPDYFFFVEKKNRRLYGSFRQWSVLEELKANLQGTHSFWVGSKPEDESVIKDISLLLERRAVTWSSAGEIETGAIDLPEVEALIRERSPEHDSVLLFQKVSIALREGLYFVRRATDGRPTYVHFFNRTPAGFEGVFFWSDLEFPETMKEFYRAHEMTSHATIRASVMRDNHPALRLHELMGYEDTGHRGYLCLVK